MMHAPLVNLAFQDGVSRLDWWRDWRGETVAIVASGPSAARAGVEDLRGRARVVAVNESWQLCRWADALYGCDGRWWQLRQYVPEFKGLKMTFDADTAARHPEIKKIEVDTHSDKLRLDRAAHVGSGGNSGFQTLNIVAQFGASKILLVGFDIDGEHWHGRHPPPLSNPCATQNFPRWRRALDCAASTLMLLGIKVINCSRTSTLTCYPKMTIEEALRV